MSTSTSTIVELPSLRRPTSRIVKLPDVRPSTDVEGTPADPVLPDPYSFRDAIKSDNELQEFRGRNKSGKQLARYHVRQNELIGRLLMPLTDIASNAKKAEDAARSSVRIAIWASLIANFCLAILQIYGAASSASLSLLATGVDSVFDFGSNVMLYWLHKKAKTLDVNKWPVGGSRLETIGNVVYGSLMAAVNLVIIVEAVRTIISHGDGSDTNAFHLPSIIAVAAALGVKCLLFLYCLSIRHASSQVEILWEDHRNDLFVYGFGILMSAGGSKLVWWLDPAGGMIIALGVIIAWSKTSYQEYELLAGKSAPHDFLQLVIYKALTFSNDIEKIDTVRAYHSGPLYFVEIDIVMAGDTPLWKAHDISQELQDKIEELPGVERAFVHVDHETTHRPEHRKYE